MEQSKRFQIPIKGFNFDLEIPLDPDALLDSIDEEDFARDERMPYWAMIWPASVALAECIADHDFPEGSRILELGCGLGLPALVAAKKGASVMASDYEAKALEFVQRNAGTHGIHLDTTYLDWREPEPLHGFHLVIGADLLYERRLFEPLLRLILRDLGSPRPEIWLADPKRALAEEFLKRVRDLGLPLETRVCPIQFEGKEQDILWHLIKGEHDVTERKGA